MEKALNGLVKQPDESIYSNSLCFILWFRRIQKTQRKTTEDMVKHNETQSTCELNMNCNEALDVAKDENVCETLIKDCPM